MKKILATAYSIILILIIIYPPWYYQPLPQFTKTTFVGFKFIGSDNWGSWQIHVGYLLLEILVVSLIFGVFLYLNKDKK